MQARSWEIGPSGCRGHRPSAQARRSSLSSSLAASITFPRYPPPGRAQQHGAGTQPPTPSHRQWNSKSALGGRAILNEVPEQGQQQDPGADSRQPCSCLRPGGCSVASQHQKQQHGGWLHCSFPAGETTNAGLLLSSHPSAAPLSSKRRGNTSQRNTAGLANSERQPQKVNCSS